jgi:hypothetical protein
MKDVTMDNHAGKCYDDDEKLVYDAFAYVFGFFLGDGSLVCKKGTSAREVRFGKPDVECLQKVVDTIMLGFGKKPSVWTERLKSGLDFHRVSFCSTRVFDFLAINTGHRSYVPEYYFTASKPIQKELIAGLMDSDGSVNKTESEGYPRWQLQFTSTSERLVSDIRGLLSMQKVRVNGVVRVDTPRKVAYHVRPNLLDFAKNCYFCCKRKQDRVIDYMRHVHASETLYTAPCAGEDKVQPQVKA